MSSLPTLLIDSESFLLCSPNTPATLTINHYSHINPSPKRQHTTFPYWGFNSLLHETIKTTYQYHTIAIPGTYWPAIIIFHSLFAQLCAGQVATGSCSVVGRDNEIGRTTQFTGARISSTATRQGWVELKLKPFWLSKWRSS